MSTELQIRKVGNDAELRTELHGLAKTDQRVVAALFIENTLDLTEDQRVHRAVELAKQVDAPDEALADGFNSIKRAMIDSRTRCGAEGDWDAQAEHFVIRAAEALKTIASGSKEALWQVVQNCRMARSCALIARDDEGSNPESARQYEIFNHFVGA